MSFTRPRPVIPAELPGLLHSLSFSVIKDRPQDIIGFAAEHFQQLLEQRKEEQETAARKGKVPTEELSRNEDAYAWRESYFQPNEWQVFSDNLEPEGRIDSKSSVKFRIEAYEDEKPGSLHNLEESGPNQMAEEIVNDRVSAEITSGSCDQISEVEMYPENEELNNSLATGVAYSEQITPEPTYEAEKPGSLHNLEESDPNQMAEEIVNDRVSAEKTSDSCDQISEVEMYPENELNANPLAEVAYSEQIAPEPIYEAEKPSSSHNLDESGSNEMAEEIVKDQVSAEITSDMTTTELGCNQISEEEKYAKNKELNNSLTTEESNSGQTTPEPIDKSETLSSSAVSSELLTEELSSNPDLTILSENSEPSENLSLED